MNAACCSVPEYACSRCGGTLLRLCLQQTRSAAALSMLAAGVAACCFEYACSSILSAWVLPALQHKAPWEQGQTLARFCWTVVLSVLP